MSSSEVFLRGPRSGYPPGHTEITSAGGTGRGLHSLWMIRHLPGNPYAEFTFAQEHIWALDAAQQGWLPPAATVAGENLP